MPVLAHAVVSKQADVILQLGTTNLADLAEDELFWRPAASSWSVTSTGDRWVADWVEPEPADRAPPTLGWQLWHASWWLSMVLDHSFDTGTLTRAAFRWEGPARGLEPVVELHHRWTQHLAEVPEQRWEDDHLTRWPYADGRPFALVAGWVNMELTKNIAEMVRARGYAAAGAAGGPAGSALRS